SVSEGCPSLTLRASVAQARTRSYDPTNRRRGPTGRPGSKMAPMKEQLSGTIERVTFHNPENGFAVLRVQARGHRGPVTVVGHLPSANAGEYVEATGAWVQERDHGLQFRADEL